MTIMYSCISLSLPVFHPGNLLELYISLPFQPVTMVILYNCISLSPSSLPPLWSCTAVYLSSLPACHHDDPVQLYISLPFQPVTMMILYSCISLFPFSLSPWWSCTTVYLSPLPACHHYDPVQLYISLPFQPVTMMILYSCISLFPSSLSPWRSCTAVYPVLPSSSAAIRLARDSLRRSHIPSCPTFLPEPTQNVHTLHRSKYHHIVLSWHVNCHDVIICLWNYEQHQQFFSQTGEYPDTSLSVPCIKHFQVHHLERNLLS